MTRIAKQYRAHCLALVLLLFSQLLLQHSVANAQPETIKATNSSALFDKAVDQLEKSNQSEARSKQAIVSANALRKQINKLRASIRNTSDPEQKKALQREANTLTSKLRQQQDDGSKLRQQTKHQRKKSLELFEQGIVEQWADQVRSRSPILMDDRTTLFFSHNTKFRSVHPNMLNRMGTPTDNIDQNNVKKDMTILVPALAEQNAPQNLDISSFQLSREQRFFAHIEVKPSNEGDDSLLVPANTIHKWVLFLSDLSGKPVSDANIEIVGHMPGHVHGLPTQPRVTKQLSPGVYLVEGLKFQMKGWWVMQFNIADSSTVNSTSANTDSITFNLVL